MLNMALKTIEKVRASAPPNRTRYIGFRLREADAGRLLRLAAKERVGLSTYVRMVIEDYVAKYGKGGT